MGALVFKAILIDKQDGAQSVRIVDLDDDKLPDDPVTVRVEYSTINYKDGLAITGKSPVVRKFPMVPGIDLRVSSRLRPANSGNRASACC